MDAGALAELGSGLPWAVKGVLRDGDNAALLSEARLVAPFLAAELGCEEEEAVGALERVLAVLPALSEDKVRAWGWGEARTGRNGMAACTMGSRQRLASPSLDAPLIALPFEVISWPLHVGGAQGRLAKLGVPRLATLCRDTPALVRRLIMLKELFPGADVGQLAVSHPFLLTEEEAQLREGLACLAELFPFAGEGGTPGVDRMAAAVPQLLDAAFARGALAQLAVLYGDGAAAAAHRDPRLMLQVESASLRSRYSASFDQTHVRANKVVPVEERAKEAYYDGE